ncbi:hypothetical protein PENSPDRAFT_690371 [Peniophora sp. CONT]|nr:hypothetical protein PENSPDRAFT_690371 [Peniophora sp. CONT]
MHELTASAIDNALGTLLNQQLLYLVRGTSSTMLGEENWILDTARRPLRIPLQNGIITYRGILRTADSSRRLSVVVKLGRHEDTFDKLVRLGELYARELFDEKRPYVPLSYGAFRRRESTGTPETRVVGCLVLEDCGKHLSSLSHDRRITDVFKVRLFNAFVKCHDAGVYRELDEDIYKHVFEVRGSPRIIGFTDVKRDHKCVKDGTTKRLPSFRGFMLEPEDFPRCDDIYTLGGTILDLWVPNSFVIERFDGQVFNVEEWLPKPIAIAELRPSCMSRTRGISAVMESICQYLEEHFPPAGKEYRVMMDTSLGKWCELYEKHGPKLSNALNGVVPAPAAAAEA